MSRINAPVIDRIEPPHWWAGMATDTLQLMICGAGIGAAKMSLHGDYPGIELLETICPGSPDYLIAYLRIAPETQPGNIGLDFTAIGEGGSGTTRLTYELRRRNTRGASGFDTSDVLYLLMPDRFAKGTPENYGHERDGLRHPEPDEPDNPDSRHGGNIAGIIQHLDYVDNLGVTAIWVNPVLENDMPGGSYHGYATTDYYRIDPRLGTRNEWISLVDSCHDRNIKVVMDMIFNHCGSEHPWFRNPPSSNWFNFPTSRAITNHRLSTLYDPYASDYDRRLTTDGWFVKEMPDLNLRNPHLRRYLIQNSIWWIEESGIDGIRMDTYPYADSHAMSQWCREVKREYPHFNIVGECWYGHEAPLAFWQRGSRINELFVPELPTVMDFRLMTLARDAFHNETVSYSTRSLSLGLNDIYNHLGYDFMLPDPKHILTFLDNHDTDRFLPQLPDNLGSWKQAMTFLLTSRGIPQIYYGTELLMHGSKENSDGNIRLMMPEAQFTRKGRSALQNEAYDYLSSLLQWRRSIPEFFSDATLRHFAPVGPVYAYTLTAKDVEPESIFVILNGSDSPATVPTAQWEEATGKHRFFTDVLTGKTFVMTDTVKLQPRESVILRLKRDKIIGSPT